MPERTRFDDRIDEAFEELIKDDVVGYSLQIVTKDEERYRLGFDWDELDGKQQAEKAERMLAIHLLGLNQADDDNLHNFAQRIADKAEELDFNVNELLM